MRELLETWLDTANSFIWGPVMLVLLLGVGLYLTVGMRALPWRRLGTALAEMWRGRRSKEEGDITPFQALMTALSGAIGTGNIAGVATAITLGGPGAIFWMWITALIGMATSFSEAYLAVRFRERDWQGNHMGGPMYYIHNGLGPRWKWLATAFALFAMIAAFGIGNMVQANSVADAVNSSFGVPALVTGIILSVLTGAVILGGIKRIGEVAGKLVPFMAIAYVTGALVVIISAIDQVPAALAMIVNDAFTGTAAAGGFAGASVWAALRFGIARGVFSNEAGLGSTPMAHAAAQTSDPVRQGMVAMLGTFIDTIIVCTMTALVILITGAWTSGETGASLSALAFNTALPGPGDWIVSVGLILFAYSTLLAWSYYGERCAEYLFGSRIIRPYRMLWLVIIIVGAVGQLSLIWLIADLMNGLMAIPNLIALALLSPLVFKAVKPYLAQR